jgi:hypothetical protein
VRRDTCGGCGSSDLRQFLDLGETPLADAFPTSAENAARQDRWPLGAAVCGSCWLVQLTEVVPDALLWGGDYGFYTGASPSAVEYFGEYALDIYRRHPDASAGFAVEIACNDGTLLAALKAMGRHALGVEPAKGPAEAARAKGLDVIAAPFGREVAQAIVDTEGQASLVIANNVLAHVADLDDFLTGLRILLARDGVLVVEVQYLGDLLLGNGLDLLYHEHRHFFSLATLASCLAARGMPVRKVERTSAQCGSLRITAGWGATPSMKSALDAEAWLRDWSAYAGMQGRAGLVRERLRDLVASERAQGRTVVGYGAPAKATTLLHHCGLTSSDDIEVIYDATPSKDRRFMPGTDIQIVHAPTLEMGDANRVTALMLPHNYAGGIIRREREFLDRGGRFIVPLPVPVLL